MNNLLSRKLPFRIIWEASTPGEVEYRNLILRKGRMETNLHIALKVLAYCYFWDRNLTIEPLFRLNRYKPDLIAWRKSEIPTKEKLIPDLWIECKNVKLKKLSKLSRLLPFSEIIWVNSKQLLTRTIKSIQSKKQREILASNVQLIGIETSKQSWESLEDSINVKKPEWKINRHSNTSMVINLRTRNLDPVTVEFHVLSTTIKT
ncbi:MAG: hypothetical protein JSW11_19620 [Candidatus Heimdallarchaeota archaeon]|nr:MAG: hypothetical protein JSW11_19620 [Candidatus Heimdallarchaeota archaeon]